MLLVFAMQLLFPEALQHRSQMGNVLVFIFGVNQDIIYEHHLKLA